MTEGEVLIGGGTLLLATATLWLALEARRGRHEAAELQRQSWRRDLYAELLERIDVMAKAERRGSEEHAAAQDRALTLVFQLDLIAPSRMWDRAADLYEQARNLLDPEQMDWTPEEAADSYDRARHDFRDAARAELLGTRRRWRPRWWTSLQVRIQDRFMRR